MSDKISCEPQVGSPLDGSDGDEVLLLTRGNVESALTAIGISRPLIIDALKQLAFYVGDLNPTPPMRI